MNKIDNGVYPVYVKDGVVYPIALTKEEYDMFELTARVALPKVTVDFNHPLGRAVNLSEVKGEE